MRMNTVYPAIQGEGCMSGVPMILVRLQGCNLRCPWCDTKETWACDDDLRVDTIGEASAEAGLWAEVLVPDLIRYIEGLVRGESWVLLTGGEPGVQQIDELVCSLRDKGLRVAVETNGIGPYVADTEADWVCLSPKDGGEPLPAVVAKANEVKVVVAEIDDVERWRRWVEVSGFKGIVCLQPRSMEEEATRICVEAARATGWRLSVQTHKLLGLA
jgi:7-carboxy-7-deazaguanine synthase